MIPKLPIREIPYKPPTVTADPVTLGDEDQIVLRDLSVFFVVPLPSY